MRVSPVAGNSRVTLRCSASSTVPSPRSVSVSLIQRWPARNATLKRRAPAGARARRRGRRRHVRRSGFRTRRRKAGDRSIACGMETGGEGREARWLGADGPGLAGRVGRGAGLYLHGAVRLRTPNVDGHATGGDPRRAAARGPSAPPRRTRPAGAAIRRRRRIERSDRPAGRPPDRAWRVEKMARKQGRSSRSGPCVHVAQHL